VGPWGDHSYAYDAAGNRTDFRTDTGGVVAYQFAINSGADNQVTQVQDTNGATLRNLVYRDGGDLYEDARVGGSIYQYYYNARNGWSWPTRTRSTQPTTAMTRENYDPMTVEDGVEFEVSFWRD
jgi:hypothetical protein